MYTQRKVEHEYEGGVEATVRYLVCALPRSGSSLLCELLFGSGRAGAPAEYFDALTMAQFRSHWGTESFDDYVRTLLEKKTGPNGVFGFKAQYFQLIDFFPGREVERAFPGLRYVYITREDTLRQAISWVRAAQTRRWAWDHRVGAKHPEVYRRAQVERRIEGIAERERCWEQFFAACGAEPLRVTYEQVVASPHETVAAVLRHIDVDPAGLELAPPTLRRQADELTDEWVRRYRDGDALAAAPW
jgi:trehalose 2-sulfotransferase